MASLRNFSPVMLKLDKPIVALTCYDFLNAKILEECGVDLILVGDSLGMVIYGEPDTKSVTIQDIVRHTLAVMKGAPKTLVCADLPLESCVSAERCVADAKIVFEKTGCKCFKVEGSPDLIKALVAEKFMVMGHTGLKPQTVSSFKVQGKGDDASSVFDEAKEIENAGAFSVVLECIPSGLAKKITEDLKIPTIGIGAGLHCSGQILVLPDMLGMNPTFNPKFLRKYADFHTMAKNAIKRYKEDVKGGIFPSESESY